MAKILQCDRCGKQENRNSNTIKSVGYSMASTLGEGIEVLDLCLPCRVHITEALKIWLKPIEGDGRGG